MTIDTVTDWTPVSLAAVFVGLLCGLLGPYLVWRKLGLLGDALGHSSASAAALAHWMQVGLSTIFIPFGLLVSFLLAWISEDETFDFSSTLAVVFVGFFALGVLGLLGTGESAEELVHFIVGGGQNIFWADVGVLAGTFLLSLGYMLKYRRDLILISVHQDLARVNRVPVRRHHYVIVALAGVSIMLSLKVTGVLLVTSLLMAPPLVAGVFAQGLRMLLILSPLVGGVFAFAGAWLARSFQWPLGATIAATAFLALLFARLVQVGKKRLRFYRVS
ncbi:MAG: metal ABC transporter permease [Bdellovibrionales bacterium]|nr:metal ABC transporter permease [Bdellovibrionales bacterium]